MATQDRFRVVIAGGGVAALETAFALRELAGDRIALQLLAPEPQFTYRPMSVGEPFAYAAPSRYPLAQIAGDLDAELVVDTFGWVDRDRQVAHTEADAGLSYDALVLALGARPRPAYEHVVTVDDRRMDELLHGIVQDVEGGYVRSLVFLAPERLAWPLPIYELALLTANRADDMQVETAITVVTGEPAPLSIFGGQASQAVAGLLADAGITMISSSIAAVPDGTHVIVTPGAPPLHADRVIALPELFGPAVRGVPADVHGFLPVDRHGQVRDAPRVYAAGDATDFAIKHGGIASQQADAAAEAIAALAGAAVEPQPFRPEIHGMLLTGRKPLYLTARITGGEGFSSQVSDEATWTPAVKIAARYLAPYLDRYDHATRQ